MLRRTLIVFVMVVPALSGAQTAPVTQPAAGGKELAVDDGASAGKLSIAGGGHAQAFDAPGDNFVLTGVRLFGSRYGHPTPPAEDFHVYLLDQGGKTLRAFAYPYKTFTRGEPKWVELKTDPTPLPRKFFICVSFNPERTKGVYVHYDAARHGDPRQGLPGALDERFSKGDWMIRALLTEGAEAQKGK